MATIARHRPLDEVRRKDAMLPIEECSEVPSLASNQDNVSRDLVAALHRLSREKRSMLVQAYCYGLTRGEIAKRTGRPIPTVKTWLRRALAGLRVYVTEQESATLVASTWLAPIIHEELALAFTKCVTSGPLSPS